MSECEFPEWEYPRCERWPTRDEMEAWEWWWPMSEAFWLPPLEDEY